MIDTFSAKLVDDISHALKYMSSWADSLRELAPKTSTERLTAQGAYEHLSAAQTTLQNLQPASREDTGCQNGKPVTHLEHSKLKKCDDCGMTRLTAVDFRSTRLGLWLTALDCGSLS